MHNLAFFSADTLGMILHQMKDGSLKGQEIRKIPMGPWNIEVEIEAQSDLISGTRVSFWVTIAKTLRLYLVVSDIKISIMVLDPVLLKECMKEAGSVATIRDRVVEIKPAMKALFQHEDSKWGRVLLEGKH